MTTDTHNSDILETVKAYDLEIEADGIRYLEELVQSHPVKIDMVVQALCLYRRIRGVELIRDNLGTFANESLFAIPFYVVIGHVCLHYGVHESILKGPRRDQRVYDARLSAVYLLHTYAKQHLPYIGYWLNRDSHLAACMLRTAKEKMRCDDEFCSNIQQLTSRITTIAFRQYIAAYE